MIHHYSSGKANKSYTHIYYWDSSPCLILFIGFTRWIIYNMTMKLSPSRHGIPPPFPWSLQNGCFPQIGFFGSPPWHQMAHGCWALGPGHGAMAVRTRKEWDDRMGFQFLFFWGTWDLFFVLFRMGIFCQHSDIIRCWSAVDCNIVTHGFLSEHQAAVAARPTDSGWHAEHAIRGFQEIGSSDHTSYQLAIYFPYKTPAIV